MSLLLGACSTKKNTAAARFYHGFTTRYNVYYNGKLAYDDARREQVKGFSESYAVPILTDPVAAKRTDNISATSSGGAFDRALEKGRKAIRYHSIRTKPPKKRGRLSTKEQLFLDRNEYNPFIHNAWELVGVSQFYNGNFLEAMATFAYMARLYSAQPEIRDLARAWQARSYLMLGWSDESKRLLDAVDSTRTGRTGAVYAMARTELALSTGDTLTAISYLPQAIKGEKVKLQRTRLHYLRAQLLASQEKNREAARELSKVINSAPPFPLEFAAELAKIELSAATQPQKAIATLNGLAKREKNKDRLDAVYLLQGNIYLSLQDTVQAIEAYKKGAEKSTQKQYDYLLVQLALGDLLMTQRDFLGAQKAFAEAAAIIEKSNPRYTQVTTLSGYLDELSAHAQVVHDQDSLRHLAQLPQDQQLKIIDSAIVAYKEAQKEAKKEAALQEQQSRQEQFNQDVDSRTGNSRSQGVQPRNTPTAGGRFYFYNDQLIAQGKIAFERKWGKRALEDNWQRRSKGVDLSAQSFASVPTQETDTAGVADSLGTKAQTQELDSLQDPTHRAYYLAQLPTTPEQIAQSDGLIQTALLGMAEVLNAQMELFREAIEVYLDLLRRYPQYEDRLEVYYSLFMLYSRLEMDAEARLWQQKLASDFPDDPLARLASQPQYIQNLKEQINLENELYNAALEAYFAGRSTKVHELYKELREKFPRSVLLAQGAFLDALAYLLDGQGELFQQGLREIVDKYPQGEVSLLSQGILSQLVAGRRLVRGGYTSINRGAYLVADSAAAAANDTLHFSKPPRYGKYYALLLYPAQSVDKNALIYAVAGFNFSRFTQIPLDVTHTPGDYREQISVGVLPGAVRAWEYVATAYDPQQGYLSSLPPEALLVAVDERNLSVLQAGASIDEYMQFLSDSVVKGYPQAGIPLSRWHQLMQAQDESQEVASLTPADSTLTPADESPTPADAPLTPADSTHTPADESPTPAGATLTPADTSLTPVGADSVPADTLSAPQTDTLKGIETPTVPAEEATDSVQGLRTPPGTIAHNEQITPQDVKEAEADRLKREKAEAKAKKEALKQKEEERKAQLRAQQKERAERERQLREERRQREAQRKAELKQKEAERKAKREQLERERRERIKESKARKKKG